MTDATRLLRGLEDYTTARDQHLIRLREQGATLDAAWIRLREVYHGQGAEVFAQAFERSREMIMAYTQAAQQIVPVIRSRIDALSRFDSPDAPPL
jgi:hypothetical protein